MKTLSISFTVGKPSSIHGANIQHNNRDFYASNVNLAQVDKNIRYISEAPEAAYEKLFSEALEKYNREQRKSRRIDNYYEHISKSKREEAYYEAIVQFGDKNTAACDNENGIVASEMLTEYLNSFRSRNSNLYVFNAIQHRDEATPHLHINFIPFYTKGRTNGLSKGVSLRSALVEQGFSNNSVNSNSLIDWEETERSAMEHILNKHGFTREDKNAKHVHMNVEDYKIYKEEQKISNSLIKIKRASTEESNENTITRLKEKLSAAEYQNKNLSRLQESKIVPLYYSTSEKLDYMINKLSENNIPFSETATGLELQDYYLKKVRELEKAFVPVTKTYRDILKDDIDLLVLNSSNFDELLKNLEAKNYTIKKGKYISAKPEESKTYIRFKSLGEFYSEEAIQNRINSSKKFEKQASEKITTANKENHFEYASAQAISIYVVALKRNALPRKKKNQKLPFSFVNDAQLDRLLELNKKINDGLTLDQLRNECEAKSLRQQQLLDKVESSKNTVEYLNKITKHCKVVFENVTSTPEEITNSRRILEDFSTDRKITKENYTEIFSIIDNQKSVLENLNSELQQLNFELKNFESTLALAQQVYEGTYVQTIVRDQKIRNIADFIPAGKTVR